MLEPCLHTENSKTKQISSKCGDSVPFFSPKKKHFVLVARAFYLSVRWEILPKTETLVKNYNMNILTSHVTTLLNYTIS